MAAMTSETIVGTGAADANKSNCTGGPDCDCESCRAKASGSSSWVYALGAIAPRFPRLSVERELMQAIGRNDAKGQTDRQALHAALSKPENRYLVRQLCWVFSVERVETYILVPRDPGDYSMLVEALRPNPSPADLDVVIGARGPVAPPEVCNGLRVPIVAFDQLYSFDREQLVRSIPRPEKTPAKEFAAMAEEVLDRVLQVTRNGGATDGDRACNYLATRDPAIYSRAAEEFGHNNSLTSIDVRPSPLAGARKIVDVIFCYTHRSTDVVEKFCVRVDVTDEFPFLISKLSPYYDR
jgi:hypothetical protein